MKDVDEITLGMSGPADSLLIAANSGDPALLEEQARAIRNLAFSLQSVAEDAVQGSVSMKERELDYTIILTIHIDGMISIR